MENINRININSSEISEKAQPKKIKTKQEDFVKIEESDKILRKQLLDMIDNVQKGEVLSTPKVETSEEPKTEISDIKVETPSVSETKVVEVKETVVPEVEAQKEEQFVAKPHKYSFEMEPAPDMPKWREAKQTNPKQMPDASSINYSGSADFNLELACKNTDKDSLEHRVYTLGINIINSLKNEKKKLEEELENGERDYSDQIKGYELQIEQLQATFKSQLDQLQKRVESAKNEKESYQKTMKVKIEDKDKEISTKRNEIKTAGGEAKKADNLAKQQKQLAEEQMQIITGIEKFSPELLKPVKITNLSGDTVEEDNIFSKIREIEEPNARAM